MTHEQIMSDRVLLVGNDSHDLDSLLRLCDQNEIPVLTADNAPHALDILSKEEIAAVIVESHQGEGNETDFLSRIADTSPDTVNILLTGHADLIAAVDAVNRGDVFRFIIRPFDDDTVRHTVREAVRRYQLIQSLKIKDESRLLQLAQEIELIDPYTRGHCESVEGYAMTIAEALNLPEETRKILRYGSWLHDCGKMAVPGKILNKNGGLTIDEFEIIKNHPRWGAEIALQAGLSPRIVNIILRHHERFDGSGYPSGMEGRSIPFEARVVTVADVFSALITDRPYRSKFSEVQAVKIMQIMKGNVFDPEILDLFIHDCLNVHALP